MKGLLAETVAVSGGRVGGSRSRRHDSDLHRTVRSRQIFTAASSRWASREPLHHVYVISEPYANMLGPRQAGCGGHSYMTKAHFATPSRTQLTITARMYAGGAHPRPSRRAAIGGAAVGSQNGRRSDAGAPIAVLGASRRRCRRRALIRFSRHRLRRRRVAPIHIPKRGRRCPLLERRPQHLVLILPTLSNNRYRRCRPITRTQVFLKNAGLRGKR